MQKVPVVYFLLVLLLAVPTQAQDSTEVQSAALGDEKAAVQTAPSALAAYTKWREATLPRYAQQQGAPRLMDGTAQVEMLVAADMKHSALTVRAVTLARQANGEVTRGTQALEITWEPKNDKADDPSNKVLVLLGKEPAVAVNGYISGEPVR